MIQFLYSIGSVLYQFFTLWLATIGVLLVWDIYVSKCRRKRNRLELESWSYRSRFAFACTLTLVFAAAVDAYLISPALGAGINFFFAG